MNEATLRKVAAAATAGTTDVESSVVSAAGGVDVTFFADIAVANAGNYIKVQGGALADGSDMADLAGSKVVAAVNDDVVAVNVFRPVFPYLRAVVVRTVSTASGPVYCAQRGARVLPPDNNLASEIVSEVLVSPAAGTA